MKNLRFVDLTEEEQVFLGKRFREYMKDEYEDEYLITPDNRSQSEWAHDKAWDDALNMKEVVKSLGVKEVIDE